MRSFLLLLFCSAAALLSAQENARTQHRLTASFSPELAYFTGESPRGLGKQYGRGGYRFRIDAEFRMSRYLWGRLGVGFAQLRFKQEITSIYWVGNFVNTWGNEIAPSGEDLVGYYGPLFMVRNEKMIVVPAAIRGYLHKQVYTDVELGANFIFLPGATTMVIRPGLGLALGWQIPLGPKQFFFIQPTYHFIWRSIKKGLPYILNRDSSSIGLQTGIRGFLRH